MNEKVCGRGWGIGTNFNKLGEVTQYGFPESRDPRLFQPDAECCTEKEIKNWAAAVAGSRTRDICDAPPEGK